MGQRDLSIGLDSAVFRNTRFLHWLREVAAYRIHISVVVYVETLYWYKASGLTKQDFDQELQKTRINAKAITEQIADSATTFAFRHRREYPFRQHARDYLIGATAHQDGGVLITSNVSDFAWLRAEGTSVKSPEEPVREHLLHRAPNL